MISLYFHALKADCQYFEMFTPNNNAWMARSYDDNVKVVKELSPWVNICDYTAAGLPTVLYEVEWLNTQIY